MLVQAGHAGKVLPLSARGEVLNGALLVGQEEVNVHPRGAFRGAGPARTAGDECGNHEGGGAQEITALHDHPPSIPSPAAAASTAGSDLIVASGRMPSLPSLISVPSTV